MEAWVLSTLKMQYMHWRNRRRRLPSIKVEVDYVPYKSRKHCFVNPNRDQNFVAFSLSSDGGLEKVGSGNYGISPLHDRLYLYEIRIGEGYKCQGYGLSLLCWLYDAYGLPITPVHAVESSAGFWKKAAAFPPERLVITKDLPISEMDDEKKRWHHLKAASTE